MASIWLLDLEVGGRVFRIATERCAVASRLGPTYVYEAGLGDLDLGSGRLLGARSVSVEITGSEDWSAVGALDERRATIRAWESGTLEQAPVYVSGLTAEPEISDGGASLSLTIADDIEARALVLPASSAVTSSSTWPASGRANYELPESQAGKVYPVLIGYPGDHPDAVDIAEPAFPIALVEEHTAGDTDERWLVGVGRLDAVQVSLWYESSGELERSDQAVAVTTDLLGTTVSYLQVGSLSPSDATYWGGMKKASGWGGGILSPYTGVVMRGAGEVARYILDYYAPTLRIDRGRMAAAQAWLDRFAVDGVILGENAVTWLRRAVLDFLPVLGVDGPDGFYLAPLRFSATATDAVAYLSTARGVALDGPIRTWDEPVRNRLTLRYRPRRMGAEYASSRTLSSDRTDWWAIAVAGGAIVPPQSSQIPWIASSIDDERVYGSKLCRTSQARYGVREYTADHPACWDDATALLILQEWAARWATPKRQARYTVDPEEWGHLLPGDVVVLTDADNGLDEAVCLVIDRTLSAVSVALDLVLL